MTTRFGITILGGFLAVMAPVSARAHCDALDGPVVTAARAALDARDVAKVLPWVSSARASEVQAAFDRALRVRAAGGDAQALADTWFFETVVRVHREGEGASFEGLKPAGQAAPLVLAVDRTLATGSADDLVAKVAAHVSSGVTEHFARAREAREHAGDSVDAGRTYVAAYVAYMHYVEGLHAAASGAAPHAAGTQTTPATHAHK